MLCLATISRTMPPSGGRKIYEPKWDGLKNRATFWLPKGKSKETCVIHGNSFRNAEDKEDHAAGIPAGNSLYKPATGGLKQGATDLAAEKKE